MTGDARRLTPGSRIEGPLYKDMVWNGHAHAPTRNHTHWSTTHPCGAPASAPAARASRQPDLRQRHPTHRDLRSRPAITRTCADR